jgi:hypothetical protein
MEPLSAAIVRHLFMKLHTPPETSIALSVSERTLRTLTRRGLIPHVKLGTKLVRYHLPDVLEAVKAKTPIKNGRIIKPQTD